MIVSKAIADRIVKLYRKDKTSPPRIGALFGFSGSSVRRILLRQGVKMRHCGRPKGK